MLKVANDPLSKVRKSYSRIIEESMPAANIQPSASKAPMGVPEKTS